MSAPIIWIVFPLFLSILLVVLTSKWKGLDYIALAVSVILSILAFLQPIGGILTLGPINLEIKDFFVFLGRAFVLENSDRFILVIEYFVLALFIGGKKVLRLDDRFVPLGMAVVSLMSAAIAVQPFIYSAIFIELTVLVIIPLSFWKGQTDRKGLITFLVYLSLAMPLFLLAGWLLGGIQADPSDMLRLNAAVLLLGIGFAIWLAVFPFHTWVSKYSQSVPPIVFGFIFSLLPMVILMIVQNYISGLIWLRESSYLRTILQNVGVIMIVSTGILAIFENDLKRIVSYSVLLETGVAILLVGYFSVDSIRLLNLSFIPRIIGLALATLSLSILAINDVLLTRGSVKGLIKVFPFATIGYIVSLLSIVGFPFLGAFPIRIEIYNLLAQEKGNQMGWIIFGFVAFLISIFRQLYSITVPTVNRMKIGESLPQIILISLGIVLLLLIGLLPNILLTSVINLIPTFPILD